MGGGVRAEGGRWRVGPAYDNVSDEERVGTAALNDQTAAPPGRFVPRAQTVQQQSSEGARRQAAAAAVRSLRAPTFGALKNCLPDTHPPLSPPRPLPSSSLRYFSGTVGIKRYLRLSPAPGLLRQRQDEPRLIVRGRKARSRPPHPSDKMLFLFFVRRWRRWVVVDALITSDVSVAPSSSTSSSTPPPPPLPARGAALFPSAGPESERRFLISLPKPPLCTHQGLCTECLSGAEEKKKRRNFSHIRYGRQPIGEYKNQKNKTRSHCNTE